MVEVVFLRLQSHARCSELQAGQTQGHHQEYEFALRQHCVLSFAYLRSDFPPILCNAWGIDPLAFYSTATGNGE